MHSENEFLINLSAIDDHIDQRSAVPGDLCQSYCSIKRTIIAILPVINLIPVYGKTIVKTIQFLMGVIESLCPPCG